MNAFVPPSFFREFLNVATRPLYQPDGWRADVAEQIREQWDDLLSLPLIVVQLERILHDSGILAFDDRCPATDTWYVAAAKDVKGEFWISHAHSDDLVAIARRHVSVRLLSTDAPDY